MSPIVLTRHWLNRILFQEDVFLVLLGARWLSLLPPILALLLRQPNQRELRVFGLALVSNLLLSVFHPRINRHLQRRPALLGLDIVLVTAFIALTGGTFSPYFIYALTPLVLAAFFFQIRGGLMAAAAFTPLYWMALMLAHELMGYQPNIVEDVTHLLSAYLVALVFGYSAVLLHRVKQASAELQQTQTELARSETLAAIGKMVGHLSHEIRNPLTTVGGYAYHLARKPDNPQVVKHHAQIIVEETQRLEELLTDMLDLARPAKPSLSAVNIHDLLDKACMLAGSQLPEAGKIVIEKQYDAQLPTIQADASALLRAFLNVIRNAMHFMPDGGTLTLTTQNREREIEITIADTGPGIPAAILPTIFTPFVTHRAGGTGLGLAVTQQVIEEHGGCIKVESEVGHGARFIFHLPHQPAP